MKLFDLYEMTSDQAVSIFALYGKSPSKDSYRELVKKFQLGLTGQDKDAQDSLKMVNAAWDVLKNETKSTGTGGFSNTRSSAQRGTQTGKRDYTNINYIKQHLYDLALETGDQIKRWTIWGFDGHFFRHTVTVEGNPKIFKDMAEAMLVWQTRGGNSYPCRAVFVSHASEPKIIYLIYADGKYYDQPIPFKHESFNLNPGNDRQFLDSIPDRLDDLLNESIIIDNDPYESTGKYVVM